MIVYIGLYLLMGFVISYNLGRFRILRPILNEGTTRELFWVTYFWLPVLVMYAGSILTMLVNSLGVVHSGEKLPPPDAKP